MTITATGLHVLFTQPVSPPGVPAQYAEHILGEVFLDSLAVPAVPLAPLSLNLNSTSPGSSSSSSCVGGHSGGTSASGFSSAGGSSSSGSPSGYISGSSQPGSSASGSPLQNAAAGFASLLRKKPLWVLLAFLIWQALAVGTGASLWQWRRGGAS